MDKNRWRHPGISLIRFWINKLSKRNRFLRPFLVKRYEKAQFWGLVVFIIREKGCSELGLGPEICKIVENHGYQIINYKQLEKNEIENLSNGVRGGNWQDEWPDGIIVAFDPKPIKVRKRKVIVQWPELDNERLANKVDIRIAINELVEESKHSNYIHSTDNSFQALRYINYCNSPFVDEVKSKLENIRK